MDRTGIVALLGTLLLSTVCCAAVGNARAQLASNEMAVEIHGGYLVVAHGSVNNANNLRFLLDTGATNTAIDRLVAERLGLHGHPAKVINFDKTVALESAEVEEITFGPERIHNARVMIEDLGYFRSTGLHLDGVIGLDQLRKQSFLVDYSRERVVFDPTSISDPASMSGPTSISGPTSTSGPTSMFGPTATRGMHSVPMRADARSITVEVALDDRSIWMVADTGTRGILLYEDTLKDLPANYRLEGRTTAASLGGPFENRLAIVPRLRLGGQDLDREVVLINAPGAKRLSGVSGYLGLTSLDAKQVAFSFETNQLLWKK
jgi:predicted aspartyl protease